MKLEVLVYFWDKFDSNKRYQVGDIIEWDDKDRIAEAEKLGYVKKIPEKKTKSKKGAE